MDLCAVSGKPINVWVAESAVMKLSGSYQCGQCQSRNGRTSNPDKIMGFQKFISSILSDVDIYMLNSAGSCFSNPIKSDGGIARKLWPMAYPDIRKAL